MNKTLLALYGLKWNPFAPGVPARRCMFAARRLLLPPRPPSGRRGRLCRRHRRSRNRQVRLSAHPGRPLAGERDVKVGMISRPQANIADFYREMGDLFGVPLRPHNRWGGAKILRQSWQAHIDSALSRPVLIVDEAQEMEPRSFPNCACSPPPSSIPTSC